MYIFTPIIIFLTFFIFFSDIICKHWQKFIFIFDIIKIFLFSNLFFLYVCFFDIKVTSDSFFNNLIFNFF